MDIAYTSPGREDLAAKEEPGPVKARSRKEIEQNRKLPEGTVYVSRAVKGPTAMELELRKHGFIK